MKKAGNLINDRRLEYLNMLSDESLIKFTNQKSVQKWKCGKISPSLDKLAMIAYHIGTNIDFLYGFTDVSRPIERAEITMKNLQRERLRLKLSVRDLAKKIDAPSNAIGRMENHNQVPLEDRAFLLCDLFGVSLDFLLGLTEYRNWTDKLATTYPLENILPGSALFIATEKFESNCLISQNGKDLIFPSGEKLGIYSPELDFCKIQDSKLIVAANTMER